MGINLQKGQKIDLTKGNSTIKKLLVGLGWDPTVSGNFDCDASVIVLDNESKLEETIYFGNKKSKNNSIIHNGDNLTGFGDGDDEVITVDIKNLSAATNKLIFVVNIYKSEERNQHFGMVKNAYIRIINEESKEELAKFNLSDDFSGKTALIVGEIYKYNNEWKFNAIGNGTNDKSIKELASNIQGRI